MNQKIEEIDRLKLENLILKRNFINLQMENINKEFEFELRKICDKLEIKREDVVNLNLDEGYLELKDNEDK